MSSENFSIGCRVTIDVVLHLLEDRVAPSDDGVRSRTSRGSTRTKRTLPKQKQSRASSSGLTPAQRANIRILPTCDVAEAEKNEPRERSDSAHDTSTTGTSPATIEYP